MEASTIVTTNPPSTAPPSTLYSHVVSIASPTKLVYTAGQVGIDKDGNAPASYEGQLELAFSNLRACLSVTGLTPKDILKLTFYIVNYDPARPVHRKIAADFLDGHRPAITIVPVPALARPGWLFEVEATAATSETLMSHNEIPAAKSARVDVVVVGAGLSGLQAAHDVQKAGLSCVVLEASNRVGGKTWSRRMASGKMVEVGAAWISHPSQTKTTSLARQFGLELVNQDPEGGCFLMESNMKVSTFESGSLPKFTEEEKGDIDRICGLVGDIGHKLKAYPNEQDARMELDTMTVEQFLEQNNALPRTVSLVKLRTRIMMGAELDEVSALFFIDYCKATGGLLQLQGDVEQRKYFFGLAEGTQTLSNKLAQELVKGTVVLNSPVTEILQTPSSASIKVADGTTYTCRKVIVSIPSPLYRDIIFSPPLPDDKWAYVSAAKLGYYAKTTLVFEEPWWRVRGLCGLTHSFTGPVALTRDVSVDTRCEYSLACFIVGEPGREWSLLGAAERRQRVLDQLRAVFGYGQCEPMPAPIEIIEQDWSKEQWSKGGPVPFTPPSVWAKHGQAFREKQGNIHIVGTETAKVWTGYMEGAIRSGERGAREVIEALEDERKAQPGP